MLAAWLAAAALAAPAYVDPAAGCDDARKASSPEQPLCSVARALEVVPPGGTVLLREGDHPALELDGYAPAAPVTVEAFPGERPSIAGVTLVNVSRLRVEGLKVAGPFTLRGSGRDVALVGNDVGNQRSGIWIYGEGRDGIRDLRIESNAIHDIDYPESQATDGAAGYGIRMMGVLAGVSIRGNAISRVVEDYIQGGGTRIAVEGNRFEGPSLRHGHDDAIHSDLWQIYWPARHIVFRGNVAVRTGTQNGLLFQFSDSGPPHRDVRIEDNVLDHASDGTDMQIYNTDGLVITGNTAVGSPLGTMLRFDDRVPPGRDYRVAGNVLAKLSDETGRVAGHNTIDPGAKAPAPSPVTVLHRVLRALFG
jgi:hypothetical protein